MKNITAIIALVAIIFSGCAANKHYVTAATSTIIGVEIAQNPTTQMYNAKLGYNRAEVALVPSNRGTGKTNDQTTGGGAADTTDVVMELHYGNMLSLSGSSIYQRLAVGKGGVAQPGAAFMFAKGKDGTLDPTVAAEVAKTVRAIPAPEAALTSAKLPLAKAFQEAETKTAFEKAAVANGYRSFSDFLIEVNTPSEKISAVARSIQENR